MTLKALLLSLSFSGIVAQEATPKHIFFDFHGVIGIKNRQTIQHTIKNILATETGFLNKTKLAFELTLPFIFSIPILLRYFQLKYCYHNKVWESHINQIAARDLHCNKLQKAIIRLSNNLYKPNPEMLETLKALKAQGHKLYLFSNIGYLTCQDLYSDFPEFKELFDLFETPKESVNCKNVINNKKEEYAYTVWKPKAQAFQEALDAAGCTPEDAVMVEDDLYKLPTQEGIIAARKKFSKKTIGTDTPAVWSAGILYNKRDHAAFINELKKLDLLPLNSTMER